MKNTAVAVSLVLALSFAGCEKLGVGRTANQRTVAELDAAVTQLQNEVRGLEAALETAIGNNGKWVLWRAIEFNTPGGGLLAPKPFSAFAKKDDCQRAAQAEVESVARTGEGKIVSEASYSFSYRDFGGTNTALAVFRCLPDTVNPISAKDK